MNPLGSVDWKRNFLELGYEFEPPSFIRFNERNIHYSCAANQGLLHLVSQDTLEVLEDICQKHTGLCDFHSGAHGTRLNTKSLSNRDP